MIEPASPYLECDFVAKIGMRMQLLFCIQSKIISRGHIEDQMAMELFIWGFQGTEFRASYKLYACKLLKSLCCFLNNPCEPENYGKINACKVTMLTLETQKSFNMMFFWHLSVNLFSNL